MPYPNLKSLLPLLACALLAGMTACATPETAGKLTAALAPEATPALADHRSLSHFKEDVRIAALNAGVSQATIDKSLANFEPNQHIIQLDRKQPEKTQTFDQYYQHTATDSRIKKGRILVGQNRELLARIEADYGVPASILVSLWGMESSYGGVQGSYAIIPSLATLAYEGRRHDFFQGELIKAMQIVDAGDISFDEMKGSWAGAMGQVQFMPSTFLNYAIDYTGSGHRDIWHNDADALASAANYLSHVGWKRGERWGREVLIPADLDPDLAGLDKTRTLDEWRHMNVVSVDGKKLPDGNIPASLVLPDGPSGRAFLAYNNYKVIMRWNHSTYFASTVGLISDAIDGRE
jgi:membrane-bound lytic murein transglycosylase B